jgi:subtilisin family serine protease
MKKITLGKPLAIGVMALMFSCQSPVVEESDYVDDVALKSAAEGKISYIVQLNDADLLSELKTVKGYEMRKGAVKGNALGLLKRNQISDSDVGFVYSNSIVGFSVKIAPGQAKKLLSDKSVKSIHKDKVVALAPPPGKGPNKGGDGGGGSTTQETPWGITRVGGPVSVTGKTAWIIDSGIDLDHPDLNVAKGIGFSAFTKGKDTGFDDGNGHGTHVSGTIAAIDNNIGVVGVAAGATVIPVKVLNSRGSGSYSGVIAGIDFVAANGHSGDVANMSLGGSASDALDDAVEAAAASSGVIFVLAAGNESDDANNHSPARANGTHVITVSAMDKNDNFASFSNYGNPPIDFCAPGVGIKSSVKDGGYATWNGTSMAAPHVAGLVLLGNIGTDGTVNGDPDGSPDLIAHH